MALPTILGGRTAIVDEEMGIVQDPVDQHSVANSSAPQDAAVNQGNVDTNADSSQIAGNTALGTPPDANVQHLNPSQSTMPTVIHRPPASTDLPNATHTVLRKRGHESDSEQPGSSRPMQPQVQANQSTAGAGDTIEEIDEFGIRTKVRLTVNQAEARQRIQERDAIAAQRDAIARDRAELTRKIEETEYALRSTVAQKDKLQLELAQTTQKLKEATWAAAHFQQQVNKVKSEADRQITTLQEQVKAMKTRMAAATTDHANRMKEWEERRAARERETSEKYQQMEAAVEGLKSQLKETTSQMQQLNEQHAAQVRENEHLRIQRTEVERTNAAPIHREEQQRLQLEVEGLKNQLKETTARMQQLNEQHAAQVRENEHLRIQRTEVERTNAAPIHREEQQRLQLEVEGLRNQLQQTTSQMHQLNERHAAQVQENEQLRRQRAQVERTTGTPIHREVEQVQLPRPDLERPGGLSTGNTARGPGTNVFGPIPVHQQDRTQLLTSRRHVARPNSQPVAPQPIRPPLVDQRVTDLPLTGQRPFSQPTVYPTLSGSPPIEPPGRYNQSRHSPPHVPVPAIQPSEMSNLLRTIPDNVPPYLPSPSPRPSEEPPSEDIRMRDDADEGDEADTEASDVPDLPDLVDRKVTDLLPHRLSCADREREALKPRRRKNQIASKAPLLQRQAQRQVETIAPPGRYSGARVANALLGRLHYPNSSASRTESPVIQRTLFESTPTPTNRRTSAGIFSNTQPATTSPLRPSSQFETQARSREQSPPIDPPGSIFGRHNLLHTSDRLTNASNRQSSPSGLFSDRTLRDRYVSRITPHAPAGRVYPLKEATPEGYAAGLDSFNHNPEVHNRSPERYGRRAHEGYGGSPEGYSSHGPGGYGRGPEGYDRRGRERSSDHGPSRHGRHSPEVYNARLGPERYDGGAGAHARTPRGHEDMTSGEAREIAAMVTSNLKDLIAARVNEELRSQAMPNTPRKRGNKHYPFRSPLKLRPRTQARQDLMKLGLTEVQRLLEIEEDDDIVHTVSRHTASWKELKDYELRGILPVLEPLRIAWDDPQAKWNWELAAMFQSSFIERHPAYRGREEEICEYFMQRIITLRKKLNDVMVGENESKEEATARVAMQYEKEARAKRKRTRRKKRWDDRRETCRIAAEEDPTYDDLYRVVDRYGPDGMSSDDTDGETYAVRIMPWRPAEMVRTMNHLDDLRDRQGAYGNRRPGGLPRPRERRVTQAESEREAPATLPRNLYGRGWLIGLSQFELARLDPDEDIPFPVFE